MEGRAELVATVKKKIPTGGWTDIFQAVPFIPRPLRLWLRACVRAVVSMDCLGEPLVWLAGTKSYVGYQRRDVMQPRDLEKCARYFTELTVMAGPFSGLRYHVGQAHGSVLYPKLLGTYESELHPALDRLRTRTYDDVIDIGFAEGYYLIGLAQWFPRARGWGFDLSEEAHRLCAGMAAINGIPAERLRLGYEANAASLAPALAGRALVVCDCEGCEGGLFSAAHIGQWKRADLIIECHDFIEPGVTEAIRGRLVATHQVELVVTADPRLKIPRFHPALKAHFSQSEFLRLVDERRPAAQTWIVATAKVNAEGEGGGRGELCAS